MQAEIGPDQTGLEIVDHEEVEATGEEEVERRRTLVPVLVGGHKSLRTTWIGNWKVCGQAMCLLARLVTLTGTLWMSIWMQDRDHLRVRLAEDVVAEEAEEETEMLAKMIWIEVSLREAVLPY